MFQPCYLNTFNQSQSQSLCLYLFPLVLCYFLDVDILETDISEVLEVLTYLPLVHP
jgi:hypothetical protein